MNIKMKTNMEELSKDVENISSDRKVELDGISSTIIQHLKEEDSLDIIVVCTHNSRRSQLGEAWINTLANHFGLNQIKAFSGGMEVTAFNERMVKALRAYGFNVTEQESGVNPKYHLGDSGLVHHPMYSKVYDHDMNPQSGFMAFMVCGHADENCPIVHGMKYRIPLRYKDPKEFDDTDFEEDAYLNKVREIGREMYYLLDNINLSLKAL